MKVNDLVVCIGEFQWLRNIGPKEGAITKVRRIREFAGTTYLSFYEYPEAVHDLGFEIACFRPIDYSFGESVIEKLEKESIQITVEV
jgi:hypothetical protein